MSSVERFYLACLQVGLGDKYATNPQLSDDRLTNCVIFGHDVICEWHGVEFTPPQFKRMMLHDATFPYSTVEVLNSMGLTTPGSAAMVSPGIYAFQFWKSKDPLSGGHFGFARRGSRGELIVIDATPAARDWCRVFPEGTTVAEVYGVAPANLRAVRFLTGSERRLTPSSGGGK